MQFEGVIDRRRVKRRGRRVELASFAGEDPGSLDVPAIEVRIGHPRLGALDVERLVLRLEEEVPFLRRQFESDGVGMPGAYRARVDELGPIHAQLGRVVEPNRIAADGRRAIGPWAGDIRWAIDITAVHPRLDQPVVAMEGLEGEAAGEGELIREGLGRRGGRPGVDDANRATRDGAGGEPALSIGEDLGGRAGVAAGEGARRVGRAGALQEGHAIR